MVVLTAVFKRTLTRVSLEQIGTRLVVLDSFRRAFFCSVGQEIGQVIVLGLLGYAWVPALC
jgi:hypothetical protein